MGLTVEFCKDCINYTNKKTCGLLSIPPWRITNCLVKMTKDEVKELQKSQVTKNEKSK